MNGETALIVVPSGRYARPSAWKPAAAVKPRSTTTSGTVPSTAAQFAGIEPMTWIHRVLHGLPHGVPISIGRKVCRTASRKGTGSPGTGQAVKVSGALPR